MPPKKPTKPRSRVKTSQDVAVAHAIAAGFEHAGDGKELSTAEGNYRLECPRCYAVKRMHSRPPIWPTQCDECAGLITEPPARDD